MRQPPQRFGFAQKQTSRPLAPAEQRMQHLDGDGMGLASGQPSRRIVVEPRSIDDPHSALADLVPEDGLTVILDGERRARTEPLGSGQDRRATIRAKTRSRFDAFSTSGAHRHTGEPTRRKLTARLPRRGAL